MAAAFTWPEQPDDWSQLQWHACPRGLTYRSPKHAWRAARWLNTHEGVHEVWAWRPHQRADGSWTLARRWVGIDWGALGPPTELERRRQPPREP